MFVIKKIVKDSSKSLRKKSEKVSFPLSPEDKETAQYLLDYLIFASDDENAEKHGLRPGVGLAAPQIGVHKQMIAIYNPSYDDEGELISELKLILINPTIVSYSQRFAYFLTGEGCLSVDKDYPGYVPRRAFITVEAYNLVTNQQEKMKFRGYEAIALQHEIDHLQGVLFYDHINKENPFQKIEGALEI